MSSIAIISPSELIPALQRHLVGGLGPISPVIWETCGSEVLVFPESIRLALSEGWLVVDVELEALETGRMPLRVLLLLGLEPAGAGPTAAVTVEGGDAAGKLRSWSRALSTAIWNGVLDTFQANLVRQRKQTGNDRLQLRGFFEKQGAIYMTLN